MSRDALVVGINHYQHLPSLNAPARDAEAIAQRLQTSGEFRIRRIPEVIQTGSPRVGTKTKVSLRELENALVQLFKPKGQTIPHTALFYFSGHGMQKEAGIQEGYLAVSDSNSEVGFHGLSLFWLRRLLQDSPVPQKIIWLDCCHSGELLNFSEADPGAQHGFDRLFMAASREYESAYESLNSPYSVFTSALLEGLDPQRTASGIVTNHTLLSWVSECLKGELQHPLFESSGSEIILTRVASRSSLQLWQSTPQSNQPLGVCPFRGLLPFEETHAEFFFGREEFTTRLVERAKTESVIALTGASGSGKSSIVQAGLIAQLRSPASLIAEELTQTPANSPQWRIKLLTPTEHPLRSLAAIFVDPQASDLERAEQLRRAQSFLKEGGIGLAQLIQASLPMPSTSKLGEVGRGRLLLVIDQLEEIFTLCHGARAELERQQFFDCLVDAVHLTRNSLCLVLVVRSDFLNKFALYEKLFQLLEQHLLVLPPMSYEQIKSTIVYPSQKVGLFCEPNLIYTMLLDVIGTPGELPLIQYTLQQLWQQRQVSPNGTEWLTLNAYTELGGIRGALQTQADQLFARLNPQEQQIAKRIFLALTQLGEGTEDTRRRVLKSELVSPAFPVEVVEHVLEKLIAAKLVVTNRVIVEFSRGVTNWQTFDCCPLTVKLQHGVADFEDTTEHETQGFTSKNIPLSSNTKLQPRIGTWSSEKVTQQETVEIVHESLVRGWPLLRSWLEENRDHLRQQRWIEQAAQLWKNSGQPLGAEHLLRGRQLLEAKEHLASFPLELPDLAQKFIRVSQRETQSAHRELRVLQIAVPCILLATLVFTLTQSYRHSLSRMLVRGTEQHQSEIDATDVVFSPDGSRMATIAPGYRQIKVWEVESGKQAFTLNIAKTVTQMGFSPDGEWLATVCSSGETQLWDAETGTKQNPSRSPHIQQSMLKDTLILHQVQRD